MRSVGFEQNINDQPNIQQPAHNQGAQSLIRWAWDRINVSQIIPKHHIANFVSVAPTLYILGYFSRCLFSDPNSLNFKFPLISEIGPSITSVIFVVANIAAMYIVAKQDFSQGGLHTRHQAGIAKLSIISFGLGALILDLEPLINGKPVFLRIDDHFDRKFFSSYPDILTSNYENVFDHNAVYPNWAWTKKTFDRAASDCDKDYAKPYLVEYCKGTADKLKKYINELFESRKQ